MDEKVETLSTEAETGEAEVPVAPERGEGGAAALADWGFSAAEVERLRSAGLGHR